MMRIMFKKINPSSGKASSILLILAVMLLVLIVGVFLFVKFGATKKSDATATDTQVQEGPPPPVYETQVGDIKFVFQLAQDLGNRLKSPYSYQKDLTTTERFIKVTIGAQNKGKNATVQGAWDVGNIVDSEGRNFVDITTQAYFYLPSSENHCGDILKPEFDLTPCTKLYEVSKESTALKVRVHANGAATGDKGDLLDIDIK
jgi:hypothetical protein